MITPLSSALLVLSLILWLAVALRGLIACRIHHREALTIEEGLSLLLNRHISRVFLQNALAAALGGLLTAGVAFGLSMFSSGYARIFLSALALVAPVFLIIPWMRRYSVNHVVAMLEQTASGETSPGAGSLQRLLRTCRYYADIRPRPEFFDWARRQLALRVLGIDARAYMPFSPGAVVNGLARMMVCVGAVTLILLLIPGGGGGMLVDPEKPGASSETAGVQDSASVVSRNKTQNSASGAPSDRANSGSASDDTKDGDRASSETRRDNDEQDNPLSESGNTGAGSESSNASPDRAQDPDVASNAMSREPDNGNDAGEGETRNRTESGAEPGMLYRMLSALQKMFGGAPGEDGAEAEHALNRQTVGGEKSASPEPSAASRSSSSSAAEGAPSSAFSDSRRDGAAAPPSDEGAGASGRHRISRGDGGDLYGKRADLPENADDGAPFRLDVPEEDGKKTASQPRRLPRYNTLLNVNADDVTLTPADPFMAQRIPSAYQETVRKTLTKP